MARNVGKKAKRGPELASRIRNQLIAAMDLVNDSDKTVAELLAEEARGNIIRFLELCSKYVPRDIEVTEHRTYEEMSDEELIAIASRSGARIAAEKEGAEESASFH